MNRLFAGFLAGCVATAPMTLVMQIAHRWPRPERQPLPPEQITKEFTERVGLSGQLDAPTFSGAAWASHFGFGAAAGGLYALFFGRIALPIALKGSLWGMVIWTTAYLGWVPATDILPPATRQTARRNALMIGAHLVWGLTTALLAEKLAPDQND